MGFINLLSVTEPADSIAVNSVESVVALAQNVSSMSYVDIAGWLLPMVVSVVSKIALAIIFYYVCQWIVKRMVTILDKIMNRRSIDISLAKFIISLVSISLNLIIIFTTISILGINTTSFLAVFASAGLAVGMALSGTLQNFAGGVLILFLKPFKIGDYIEAQGFAGTVKEISLFSTLLNTVDNKMVIIPNGSLSTSPINNYSKETTRRVSWVFGVAYGTDYSHVKSVLEDELGKHELVLQDQGVFVALSEFADSSINISAKVWCNSSDYFTLLFDINEKIYKRFAEEGIQFPFPQVDVHLTK
ncbi:MAG: mechanosensitive ion channel domain-containing protein [Rikenellaceae bacterium]